MRRRVAVVIRERPVPVFTGINLVIHNISASLAAEDEVKLFLTDDVHPGEALGLPVSAVASGLRRGGASASLAGPFRSAIARFYGVRQRNEEWLADELELFNPDVVLGFGYDVAPYLGGLRHRWPVVLDAIDSEVLHFARQLRQGAISIANIKNLVAAVCAGRRYLRVCDALVTVSREDSANLRMLTGHRHVAVVPNGVDCDYFAPNDAVAIQRGRLVFSGSLSWEPNVQAVQWFLRNCWGRVRAVRPDATLVIVGKNMTDGLKREFETHSGVQALGFVPDIREHVLAAQVCIAPMVSGSGIKNKVLESWAMGRAVVATGSAIRGVAAEHRRNVVVADDSAGFARCVLEVLEDTLLRERLGAEGRRTVLGQYSWIGAARQISEVLDDAIGRRSAGSTA